jgi:hypothetical protein
MWNTLVMISHNQCFSSDNASYRTTTSASHLAMWHMVPWLVPFTWQCVIRYHKKCLSYWSWYRMTHCHVKYTGRGNVWHIATWNTLVVVPYDIMPGEIHWSWYRITHWVPQPVYFTWQCVMRYHNQCISPGNVLCGTTTSVFHLA